MRKSFFAGLITLLPVVVTYIVIAFGLGIITAPFEYVVTLLLKSTRLFDHGFGILTTDQAIFFVSRILIIAFLVFFIYLVGFLAASLIFHSWGYYVDRIMSRIPVIRNVYSPSKELVNTFFSPPPETPRKAVLVPYPAENQLTVGIVTAEFTVKLHPHQKEAQEYVSVLIPSTPNATGGYLCTFLKADVRPFDLPADEALKYIMSFASNNTIAIKE